jgi:hypothetical protein
MTAKFALFDITEISLQEYARRLRLAGEHRESLDDERLNR